MTPTMRPDAPNRSRAKGPRTGIATPNPIRSMTTVVQRTKNPWGSGSREGFFNFFEDSPVLANDSSTSEGPADTDRHANADPDGSVSPGEPRNIHERLVRREARMDHLCELRPRLRQRRSGPWLGRRTKPVHGKQTSYHHLCELRPRLRQRRSGPWLRRRTKSSYHHSGIIVATESTTPNALSRPVGRLRYGIENCSSGGRA